jgi:Rrf2 family nitric oxide-sensitive transcriptional repressor
MRLADYTDYTLRVCMYCAANPERLVPIAEMADTRTGVQESPDEIVNDLARQASRSTTARRGGGVRLLKPPSEIGVGDVVRAAETDFAWSNASNRRPTPAPSRRDAG